MAYAMDESVKIFIEKLEIKPGDCLVVKIANRISAEHMARMRADLERIIQRDDVPVIVLDGACSLGVVSMPDQPAAA